MKRYLPVALLALTLAGCGPSTQPTAPPAPKPDQSQTTPTVSKAPTQAIQLVDFTDSETGIKMKVPDGWTKQKVSGGDWSGWDFRNPADPKQYVEAITSGCVGCMTNQDGVADAREVIPTGATTEDVSKDLLDATYSFIPAPPSYVGVGRVSVAPGVEYGRVDVVIDPNKENVAKEIVGSFAVTNSNFLAARTYTPQLQIPIPSTTQEAASRLPNQPVKKVMDADGDVYFSVPSAIFRIVPFAVHLKAGESVWTYSGFADPLSPPLWLTQYAFDKQGNMIAMWQWYQAQETLPFYMGAAESYIPTPAKTYLLPNSKDNWVLRWHIIGGDMYVLSVSNPDWRKGMFDGALYVPNGESNRIEVWPNFSTSK